MVGSRRWNSEKETHVYTGCTGPHREDMSQPRRPMCVHHVHRTTQRRHVSQHRRPMCVQGAQDHTERTWITTQETPVCTGCTGPHREDMNHNTGDPCVYRVHVTTQTGHESQHRRPMCIQGAQDHTDRTCITTQETHVCTSCAQDHIDRTCHNQGDPCVYRVHRTTQTGHVSQPRRPMCVHHVHRTTQIGHVSQPRRPGVPIPLADKTYNFQNLTGRFWSWQEDS